MAAGLLDWLEDPEPRRGPGFAEDEGGWDVWRYPRLAVAAEGAAAQLVDAGLQPGEVAALVVPSGPLFVASFFGVLLAGATPAPLVPPMFFEEEEDYVAHTEAMLRSACSLLVTVPELLPIVTKAGERAGLQRPPLAIGIDAGGATVARRPLPEIGLLQFTSGSSGRPRGVQVTCANLEANIGMIRDWIDWQPEESGVTWLPMYHDMGLIGAVLTGIVHERDGWIMRPDQFIRTPERWLERLGRGGAVFTPSPNFGFAYAARRVSPQQLEGSDFSAWRAAIVGAERLDPAALGKFAAALAPYGFRREAFLPAYGLAEATLAVSGVTLDRVPAVVRPDWERMRFSAQVEIEREVELGDEAVGDGAGWLVGCGGPPPGVTMGVVDEDGSRLEPGCCGEIVVGGPTVARGYEGADGSGVTSFEAGELRTGDAGFFHAGDWYVVGRIGDSLKVRGRALYAEDVEARLVTVPGVSKGRCVVLPGPGDGRIGLIAVVEAEPGEWVGQALELLEREVGAETGVQILSGPPGSIERTSSGKPRRRVIWRAVVAGELAAQLTDVTERGRPELAG